MKRITLLVSFALFFIISSPADAAIISSSSGPGQPFSVTCDLDATHAQVPLVAGGYALVGTTTPANCTYYLPTPTQFFRFVSIYKGVVGNSTPVSGELAFSSGDIDFSASTIITTDSNRFMDSVNGDDYFAVALDADDLQYITDTKEYLRDASSPSGVSPVGNTGISNFNTVAFKWGSGPTDTLAPAVTITPSTQTLEATEAGGAVASFTASALDETSGVAATTCDYAGGVLFPIGTTVVTCTATDVAGNVGSATATIVVQDTTDPVVTVTSPVQGATYLKTDTVVLGASVSDISSVTASYLFNGVAVTVGSALPLSSAPVGTSTLSISATDSYGNIATSSISFTVKAPTPTDTTAPVIVITNPIKYGLYSRSDSVVPAATVTDASPVTTVYRFNGVVVTAGSPLPLSSAPVGLNTLSVAAKDSFGNAATSTVNFFVVKTKNSCLLDILSILIQIKTNNTLPDKPTLKQLTLDCAALLKGLHHY